VLVGKKNIFSQEEGEMRVMEREYAEEGDLVSYIQGPAGREQLDLAGRKGLFMGIL